MIQAEVVDGMGVAEKIIKQLLAVRRGEEVLIVADPKSDMTMVSLLAGVVQSVGAEFTVAIQPTRGQGDFNRLTAVIERGLESADVLIGITRSGGAPSYSAKTYSLCKEKKLRGTSMVMRDWENWTSGAALADYEVVLSKARALRDIWLRGNVIKVTSSFGTRFTATIGAHPVIVEAGFAREPGEFAGFSDGEVSQAPNEGVGEGLLVINGPIAGFGRLLDPVRLVVERGKVIRVEGEGLRASKLRNMIASIPAADNVAEIGIGVNSWSAADGDFQDQKKGAGNTHVALGDNIYYGGSVKCSLHLDMVQYETTVMIDGTMVVAEGKLVV